MLKCHFSDWKVFEDESKFSSTESSIIIAWNNYKLRLVKLFDFVF